VPLSRDSLQERQLKVIRRAQFRLTQTLDRLQWEEDVLYPEIERLKAGKSILGLKEGAVFNIEVVNEDPDTASIAKRAKSSSASARAASHGSRHKSRRARS
jgi:hypothetical protein